MKLFFRIILIVFLFFGKRSAADNHPKEIELQWKELPSLPNELGVAGPYSGVHNNALIVAGGANFPRPVWENNKVWVRQIDVLVQEGKAFVWKNGGLLPKAMAYGASISTKHGVVCMGGNHEAQFFKDVFLLRWNPKKQIVERIAWPSLPAHCAYGCATRIGDVIYVVGGQSDSTLQSAMQNFWTLDLSKKEKESEFNWKIGTPFPGIARAFNITTHQHNGVHDCVYVISGRSQNGDEIKFLKDVWEYSPQTQKWRRCPDVPRCVMAGTGIGVEKNKVIILGGADGSLFLKSDNLKDKHPGFPKEMLQFDTINKLWSTAGNAPSNHVTTTAVKWKDSIIIPSGEIRPRVRSPKIWKIQY